MHQHQQYQHTRTQNVVIQTVSIFSVKQIDGNLPQKSILIVNQGQQTPRKKHYKSLKEVDRNAITETSCSGHWWRHNGHRQQHQQSKLDYATLSKMRNKSSTFFNCKQELSLGGHPRPIERPMDWVFYKTEMKIWAVWAVRAVRKKKVDLRILSNF